MKIKNCSFGILFLAGVLLLFSSCNFIHRLPQGTIINHECIDLTRVPVNAIQSAKDNLHIAYGHTSHGSQLTDGMGGLVDFAYNEGFERNFYGILNLFAWNSGGNGDALDLREGVMAGDCGYHPQWVNETRAYLNDPVNAEINVIIWSWCGQVSGRTEPLMRETYLEPMAQLEIDYPNVQFVYMTGHLDGTGLSGNLHERNEQIRDYCRDNSKWLFDFADIESYDPDGIKNYNELNAYDTCAYDGGNWAIEWQNSHTIDEDWYSCGSQHSQPLNANMKAYAAWWLWARLAGWNP